MMDFDLSDGAIASAMATVPGLEQVQ